MSAESDAALAAARAAVDVDAADGPRTHGNGANLNGNELGAGETRREGTEHRMGTESHETDKPAPAPAEVGAVVGGEVRLDTLQPGALFEPVGGAYAGERWTICDRNRGTDPHTFPSVRSDGGGRLDWNTFDGSVKVRPLTLRLVPAAPAPGDGTGEGCARCERTKAGYDAEIDALTKKVEARMVAERDSLKAALDKARADLAEAEKWQHEQAKSLRAALDTTASVTDHAARETDHSRAGADRPGAGVSGRVGIPNR